MTTRIYELVGGRLDGQMLSKVQVDSFRLQGGKYVFTSPNSTSCGIGPDDLLPDVRAIYLEWQEDVLLPWELE